MVITARQIVDEILADEPPRSGAFRLGLETHLQWILDGRPTDHSPLEGNPYAVGTSDADAWLAGFECAENSGDQSMTPASRDLIHALEAMRPGDLASMTDAELRDTEALLHKWTGEFSEEHVRRDRLQTGEADLDPDDLD